MMAFYKEYDQIPRVVPTAEMMTNGFIPGMKADGAGRATPFPGTCRVFAAQEREL